MLSPDVPEFVPRGYQTPIATNTENFKPKESISQPQQTHPPAGTHRPPPHARSDPPFVPKISPLQREREKTFGLRKPNYSWRQPREAFGNQRENQTHEINGHGSGTETFRENEKILHEKQTSQRSKGKPKTVIEDLELHIKKKFVAPKPSHSYTKILKSKQPPNSVSEAKSSKQQDFSFSTEGHWPTLGESLPLHKVPEGNSAEKGNSNPWVRSNEASPVKSPAKNMLPERGTQEQTEDASIRPRIAETSSSLKRLTKNPANHYQERGTPERNGDASVRPKSTEKSSPIKKPMKSPANPRQERHSTAERITEDSVRPRITEGNAKNSESRVKIKPAYQTPQRKAETNYPLSDNNGLESKRPPLPKDESDRHDKEPSIPKRHATAMNTEAKNSLGVQSQEAAAQVTKNTTPQEDSDFFEWKIIGEKKKKVKIKPEEEVKGSPQAQALGGDGRKYGRVLPHKPSKNYSAKENQEYISKTRGVHSLSTQETQGAIKKDALPPKAGQKEKKKPRPTKVMSLANCSNDKKETRPFPKIATNTAAAAAVAAAKPVDEETRQRRLAARYLKKMERKKMREMKAREDLILQPKDTKVSFITTNFLVKTQVASKASSARPSTHANRGAENMNFTSEEYPTLQWSTTPSRPSNRDAPHTSSPSQPSPHTDAHHHNSSPSLPSDREDPQASPSLPTTINDPKIKFKPALKMNHKSPSTKGRLQAGNLLSNLVPPNASDDDDDGGDWDAGEECAAINYRTALLSAKEEKKIEHRYTKPAKEKKPEPRHTKLLTDSSIHTLPPKKNVKTSDPIELDLFAFATKSRKNKKKESADKAEILQKSLAAKRREDRTEDEMHARNTGAAALTKGAGVVAKRGKINTKKTKKKKLSRVQKCKIEKQRRDILALQLLLEQAKVRQQQQQQELLEASPTARNKTEESTKESTEAESAGGSNDTNEALDTATEIEADKEEDETKPDKDGEEKQNPSQEKSEGKTDDCDENKENEKCSDIPHASLNISSQAAKTPAEGDDDKPKIVWKIKGTQDPSSENETTVPEESSDSAVKDKNTDEEGKASSQHSTEDEPKSSNSPSPQKLLTDDPLITERASQLIELIKSQKITRIGPREYCHQMVTLEVNAVAKELITSIITFQKRHYLRDPTKARIRKRYVCGLKETTKLMGKMSCIIMAPNIQQCEGPGSLDDAVEKLLNQAEKLKVPVVFALSTKEMKNLCHKSSRKVSCFGIISYQGAQDLFQRLMQLMPEAQKQYQQLVASGQCTLPKEGEGEEEEDEGEREPAKKDVTTEVLARTSTLLMAP